MAAPLSTATRRNVPERTPVDARTAILQAAIRILHDQGAGALTVRSVATAAGCSTTGVYTWFGGKNGLVEAIFVDGFQRFGQTLAAVPAHGNQLDHLSSLAHAYRQWALSNPTHYMVMFGRAVPDFEAGEEALVTARSTFTGLVTAMTAAVEAGVIAGDPVQLAHHLWAGIHGYVSLELSDMDMADSTALRDRAFTAGLHMLLRGCLP